MNDSNHIITIDDIIKSNNASAIAFENETTQKSYNANQYRTDDIALCVRSDMPFHAYKNNNKETPPYFPNTQYSSIRCVRLGNNHVHTAHTTRACPNKCE